MFCVSSFFLGWQEWHACCETFHLPSMQPHFGGGVNRWMDGSLVAPDLSCSSSYRHLLALVV